MCEPSGLAGGLKEVFFGGRRFGVTKATPGVEPGVKWIEAALRRFFICGVCRNVYRKSVAVFFGRLQLSFDKLMEIYELLLGCYGGQEWWPGDSACEVVVGAILTQNTNWGNVEKAIGNLKGAGCLTVEKLYELEIERLAELIRPAGYYNVKAKRLKSFLGWLVDNYGGDIEGLKAHNVYSLREELLGVKGIGPETADSILLYGLGMPVFVVDTYTCRVLGRHGLIEEGCGYEDVREYFESSLPGDVKLFNEFHALLVRVGKEFCRPKARCSGCPLESVWHDVEV